MKKKQLIRIVINRELFLYFSLLDAAFPCTFASLILKTNYINQ